MPTSPQHLALQATWPVHHAASGPWPWKQGHIRHMRREECAACITLYSKMKLSKAMGLAKCPVTSHAFQLELLKSIEDY